MNQYNGSNRSNGAKKYSDRRTSLNKFYTGNIASSPSLIQLVSLLVMWVVGMMLIFLYTDVFKTSITGSNFLYYLLIIGSTTILVAVFIAFFRRRR